MFIALALIAIAGGTLSTYLWDEGATLLARLASGACLGLTAFALLAFIYASLLGLTPTALALAALSSALPLITLLETKRRQRVLNDLEAFVRSLHRTLFLRPSYRCIAYLALYALLFAMLWCVYERAMFEGADGLSTGLANNYGDLPFHLSVITSFVKGGNFPPEDPTYAGARFTYPFLADFLAACFVRAGATLREAMLVENLLLAVALVALLYRWALVLTSERGAAHLTPVLVLLSGGLGWWQLFDDARQDDQNIFSVLVAPPHDYTIIPESIYRWGNSLTTLLVPQRSMLLGLALALVVLVQWWHAFAGEEDGEKVKEKKAGKPRRGRRAEPGPQPPPTTLAFLKLPAVRRMIAAGVVAGLLPLAHAHTFVVLMMVGACLALLQGTRGWRVWAAFFFVALLVAGPQMWWATHDSSVRAGTFFGWQLGWDRGERNVLWFWLANTGLFIPLLAAALVWRGARPLVPKRLLIFYLPFTLCFIIPNLFKLAPWIWDNIKVLFYWYVASVPLVASLLVRVWRTSLAGRAVVAALTVALTLAGALDVWRVVSGATTLQEFDRDGLAFAALIERETGPRSLVLHAPIHNHPVFLTGRRSLMGYPGHIWTHGLDYRQREAEIQHIYAGAADAAALIARDRVEYVVLSPLERSVVRVNDAFFEQYEMVGEVGEYRLYKIKRQ